MNTVSEQFHDLASGGIRPIDWELGISWTKQRNPETSWFVLDQSQLNGPDLLADSNNNPIQIWDSYEYQLMRDRVIEMNLERSIEFPYNVQCAVLDVKLNNYDGLFSFNNPQSPISQYILPSRPIRGYLGFQTAGLTPVFVGLTNGVPSYSGTHNTVAELTAMDFLSSIGDMSLRNMVMMRDARTDEVIEVILKQFGIESHMYKFEKGLNMIPFVYFESGKNAGNALRELIQAENGAMWIDEQGIIRFAPRTFVLGKESVMAFDPTNIISITPSQTSGLVNRVYIEADIRKVMDFQQVFSIDNKNGYSGTADDDQYRVKANSELTVWLSFDDPIWQATVNPELNGDVNNSSFTAVDLDGVSVASKVEATGTLFADTMKLTFSNSNNFPISVDFLQIWGEPAKIVGTSPTIKYTAEDEASIEQFGLFELNVTDNTCFGNEQNIDAFATDVLSSYASYSPILEMQVKGDPSLQLNDIVTIEGTEYDGDWLIKSIEHSLTGTGLATKLKVIRTEIRSPFILNKSVLNGPDLLG